MKQKSVLKSKRNGAPGSALHTESATIDPGDPNGSWNRLATVTRAWRADNGTLNTGSKTATLRYDGLGRRVSKKNREIG